MYDLIIIGAGWAGFNAALKAKELGLKVCLIDKASLGGTCLNQGCIPTKTLIQSAKIYSLIKKSADFGINVGTYEIDFSKIQERKTKIIQQLGLGMKFMLKGIDFISAEAKIVSNTQVHAGNRALETKFILIATGSKPQELPNFKFDGKKIISSNQALELKELPKNILIIGGGVIGSEFASLFSTFSAQVTLVEKMPQLLPGEDKDVARKLEQIFKKKSVDVHTNTDASGFSLKDFDLILLSVGRSANTLNLGLEEAGVKLENGKIITDNYLKTNIANIYAAGDCTGKIMLAHFAGYQGELAVENIASDNSKMIDSRVVPNCIFTDPEIASVGLNEAAAKNNAIDINIHKFDFLGCGMARILGESEGFIKIISDKNNDKILGASIIGPKATELIGILGLAVKNELKTIQIIDTIFAHPTLSEAIGQALKGK
ncbi:MAG: dihydrolipoyl dehydrogenase [Candidatus Omnitrophota bacterium]